MTSMRGVPGGVLVAFLAVLAFGCRDSGHPLGSTGAGGRGGAGGTSSAGGAGGEGRGGALGGSGGGAGQGAAGGTVGGSGGAAGQGGGTGGPAGRGGTAGGQAGTGGNPPLTSCPATRPAVGTACSGALTCNYNDTCRCNVCCYSGYGCMNGSIAFLGNNDGCFQISCDAGTGDGGGTDGTIGACSSVTTLAECDARTDCHPVFFDPGDCSCAPAGCCARFSRCANGGAARCTPPTQFGCTIAQPHCQSPAYVLSYTDNCFDGCVRPTDCSGAGGGGGAGGTGGATSCAACDPTTTYCRTEGGGIPSTTVSYSCVAFPAGCGATPSCACLPTASCSGICETGAGGLLTVNCAGA